MAYQNGKTYYIIPLCATGDAAYNQKILNREVQPPVLNIYGVTSSIGYYNKRNVNLWNIDYSTDMQWKIQVYNGYAHILCAGNTAFGLDYYYGADNPGNCDIYKVAGNDEDSKINFRTVNADSNLYRIQCYRNNADNNLYLTATSVGEGSDVRWEQLDTNKNTQQIWWLVPIEDIDSSTGTTPTETLVENINQNDFGNQTGLNTFCYATCILAILRYYKGTSFSMDRLINEGIVQADDGYVNYRNTSYYDITSDISFNCTEICNEIAAGRPVIIYGQSSVAGHYVVADGFTTRTTDGIIVMDPWTGKHTKLTESTLITYISYRKYTNK